MKTLKFAFENNWHLAPDELDLLSLKGISALKIARQSEAHKNWARIETNNLNLIVRQEFFSIPIRFEKKIVIIWLEVSIKQTEMLWVMTTYLIVIGNLYGLQYRE